MRVILQHGTVVDDRGLRRTDVVVAGEVVAEVAEVADAILEPDDLVIDCRDRYVLPGFVDTHAHVDGLIVDESVQRALLRQGVTSVITGQDGVSYAPGDGRYASQYFAAVNGAYPGYAGGGVGDYLGSIDGATRLNVAYAVPAGTVRWEVCGRSRASATPEQLAEMIMLVEDGMRDGAVGLSTGLDYVPGLFASTGEIAALCGPVAEHGGIYVTHMRGGYEDNSAAGIAEIGRIAADAGVRVHISHFHARPAIVRQQLDALRGAGVDATFDAYPYTRGCSLLTMPLLPPDLAAEPTETILAVITDPAERDRLRRDWFPMVARNASLGPDWPSMLTFAHLAAPEFGWAHGLTLETAAAQSGAEVIDFALDVLAACRLEVNVIMAVRHERSADQLARVFADPRHMGGSDGIFIGAHPHPRARGTFARYLREFVARRRSWSWPEAVSHLSTAPARRFGLGRRGRVEPGWAADLIVVDPKAVTDTATYAAPLSESIGIDDVLVAGRPVLAGRELAPATPGRGLRRGSL